MVSAKKKDSSVGIFRIGNINYRRRVASLQPCSINNRIKADPCLSLIATALHHNIDVAKSPEPFTLPSQKQTDYCRPIFTMAGLR